MDDEELIVVWSGKMELLPPRDQRPDPTWAAPKRKYNKQAPDLERKGMENQNGTKS